MGIVHSVRQHDRREGFWVLSTVFEAFALDSCFIIDFWTALAAYPSIRNEAKASSSLGDDASPMAARSSGEVESSFILKIMSGLEMDSLYPYLMP
jgi:hypothetical protein